MKNTTTKIEVGHVFVTNQGYECEVIEYNGAFDVLVMFNDEYGCLLKCESAQLNRGSLKNPYHPTVEGVGFMGVGSYKSRVGGVFNKSYTTWVNMIRRCYSGDKKHIHYQDVTVYVEWHNYQNFAKWFDENSVIDHEIDKDLLFEGNRQYHPSKCTFVPHWLNSLFFVRTRGSSSDLPQGVSFRKSSGRYLVQLSTSYSDRYIGSFNTLDQAHFAYLVAKHAHVKKMISENFVPDQVKEQVQKRCNDIKVQADCLSLKLALG